MNVSQNMDGRTESCRCWSRADLGKNDWVLQLVLLRLSHNPLETLVDFGVVQSRC